MASTEISPAVVLLFCRCIYVQIADFRCDSPVLLDRFIVVYKDSVDEPAKTADLDASAS